MPDVKKDNDSISSGQTQVGNSPPTPQHEPKNYTSTEDMPADLKITPPAQQTGAQNPTVVGEQPGGDDPDVEMVDGGADPAPSTFNPGPSAADDAKPAAKPAPKK